MKALTLILELLKRLLDFLKNKRIQDESEKGREDPARAFAEHFNGRVRTVQDKQSSDETSPESDRSGRQDVSDE